MSIDEKGKIVIWANKVCFTFLQWINTPDTVYVFLEMDELLTRKEGTHAMSNDCSSFASFNFH